MAKEILKMNGIIQFSKGFRKGMRNFGDTLSIIINSSLLLIIYLLGAGVTSILAKILGKHFLSMKLSRNKKSYWSSLDLKKEPIERYYRQF